VSRSGSTSFDRAAAYYDETRGLTDAAVREQTELLAGELRGRGRTLEVGVGTGQVALPLAAAGIPMTGLDIAEPMVRVLVDKAGGVPFPIVLADATRMPFEDASFGAGIARWVFHLIAAWRGALQELVRVVHPGGVVLILLGSYGKGPRAQIQDRFNEFLGLANEPVGIMWGDVETLDRAMQELGASPRALPVLTDVEAQPLSVFLDGIERNRYSWTWRVPAEDLARVAPEVRAWAVERFGPLDRTPEHRFELAWRAYDLRAATG
jgi:ubiquinone/menaquinone biosynthesis C-methylase UbiE